jgi:hypothetical protein
MRTLMLPIVMTLWVGSAQAGEKGATHPVEGDVVSIDAKAKTIKMKVGADEVSGKLKGKAVDAAKKFKVGDKVVCTCQDNAKGEHQACVALTAAAVKPAQ